MKPLLVLAAFPVVLMGWASCSHSGTGHAALPDPRAVDKSVPEYKNPFHPSTYAHFVARKDYRKTYDVYKDDTLLNRQPKKSRKIFVCLDEQRGQYLVDGLVAMDFPLSSGVKAYPTKTGDYAVISKKEDHTSNLYGKMYDAEGKCINYNAESTDPIPEGGRFDGSPMPYWQRLTNAGLGLHVGKVRRHPVSHGCVRLPRNVAEILYRQNATPRTGNSESACRATTQGRVKHVPVIQHVQGGYLQIASVQVPFVSGNRAVLGDFLHVAPSLVVVAAFHDCRAVPAGETHRTVGRSVQQRSKCPLKFFDQGLVAQGVISGNKRLWRSGKLRVELIMLVTGSSC